MEKNQSATHTRNIFPLTLPMKELRAVFPVAMGMKKKKNKTKKKQTKEVHNSLLQQFYSVQTP